MEDRESWGRSIERAAAMHILKSREYRLVGENYHARTGEIDLIFEFERREPPESARRAAAGSRSRRVELVFVEVKGRRGWTNGFESVNWVKRRRLMLTAKRFLAHYRGDAQAARFDVIVWERGEWVWLQDAWHDDGWRPA